MPGDGQKRGRAVMLAMLVTGAASWACPGLAQTGDTPQDQGSANAVEPDTPGLDDIVVTARRREERLQDVPVSVTVQNEAQLQAKGITTAMDIGKLAPSLTVTPSPRGGNTPYFVIRGQRLIDTSMVLDPVTIVYVNDVPFMRPQGLNGALFDVQSVQVLRGPQGTLFGRNTTGGAVLVNTNPATDDLEGKVSLTVGNYDKRAMDGALNIPLTDTLAMRLAGAFSQRDGYTRNRANNYRQNDEDYDAQRLTLSWSPSDRFTSAIYANRFNSSNNGSTSQIYAVAPTASTRPVLAQLQAEIAANRANPLTYGSDMDLAETSKSWDITNVSTFELSDSITLKNIVGYRDIETFSTFDLDGSSIFLQQFSGTTAVHQVSEEFQVQGTGSAFDWIAGVFYFREEGSDIARSVQSATPNILRPSGVFATNTSYSGFLSGTYRLPIDGLSLSAGARVTHDKREGNGIQAQVNRTSGAIIVCGFRDASGALIQPPCLFPQKASFTEPSWSVSLNYKASSDLLFYVAHRRGYRSGGIQSRATTAAAAVPFDPERVNDVEIGTKWEFESRGVSGRINLDAYIAWYKGLQRQISFISPISGTLVSGIFNAARSTVKGIEAEATLIPFEGLQLDGSIGYVDAQYDSFLNAGVDISAWPFSYVPKVTANAGVRYTLPTPEDTGKITASWYLRYQSSYIDSDTPQDFARLPGYAIMDARLDWNEIGGSRFGLSAWVYNLANKVYHPYATNLIASLGIATWQVGTPRTYGVTGRFEF